MPEDIRDKIEKRRPPVRRGLLLLLLAGLTAMACLAAGRTPAAAALLARPSVSVHLEWQAYEAAFQTDSPFRQVSGLAAEEKAVLILITVTPPAGHYLYAPFASGGIGGGNGVGNGGDSGPDSSGWSDPPLELTRPLALTVQDEVGREPPGLAVLYPPGERKYDPYSESELPVYNGTVSLLAVIPLSPQAGPGPDSGLSLVLSLDGLLCSANSCTPLRLKRDIRLTAENIHQDRLPAGIRDRLAAYRAFPERQPAGIDGGASAGGQAGPAGHQDEPDESRNYAQRFTPRYHQHGLEVAGLGRAMLFGLLAGFILNFMPCVLPVVTLKLGLLAGLGGLGGLGAQSEAARRARARLRTYGLFFSLGVLAWFAALFAVLGFAGLLWGQFFQSRTLLLTLAIILFLLALSLLGVFRLPLLQLRSGADSPRQAAGNGSALARQAFLGGILATLLATPCSGPLLGGVLGWAVGQPLPLLAVTLLCVGLGMAAPFLLICLNPALARFLPRPGGWSLLLEKVMGFLLLGTVIYLLSMLPSERTMSILNALLLLALAAWLWGRRSPQRDLPEKAAGGTPGPGGFVKTGRTLSGRFLSLVLAGGLTGCALYLAFWAQPAKEAHWRDFNPAQFEALLGERNLLLDFTADWCINCRALEATTLSPARLEAWGREYDLAYLKVDITSGNPAGEELLAALGSASIPVLAIFPAGQGWETPTVLRDLITPGQLDEALRAALEKTAAGRGPD